KIVGYLAAGVIFGPHAIGTLSNDAARQLAPVSSLAIALIAFLAGAELRWSELRDRGVLLLKILATELTLVMVSITGLMLLMRDFVPFLAGGSPTVIVVMSVLFGSIAIVHSPAVTIALLAETRASGPVARTTLGVVLLSDVVVILLFAAVLSIARALVPPASAVGGFTVASVLWEIGGAVIIGAMLGGGIALYLRFVRRELFLFAILVAFFGSEIARLAHVETLLTMLIAGFVAENASPHALGEALRQAIERSAAPVFVVFFALAGAALHLGALADLWFVVIPIVLVRAAALWAGGTLGAAWGGASPVERKYTWMGLVSQAGVALGLATVAAEAYPERGDEIRALFLAMLAVHETIGPIMFRFALSRAGELSNTTTSPTTNAALAPDAPAPPDKAPDTTLQTT
ncbi:MAG TPA: cation:proton antiporter, partial [Gemmatimonas sp.]|nr:cation:proton antiporter [Gemmatimonas sp.]